MKITRSLAIIVPMLVALLAHAQNTVQFNSVTNTEEGAIRLSWDSNSNEVYQIQCTDTLIDTNTGLTPWQVLYDQYPSHGTNTFWLDTGSYYTDTIIPHPKYSPMRFYRVFVEGTNDGEIPGIVITSPTNDSVLSDQVTVSVTTTSSYPQIKVKLFVDGQEMDDSDDGTNWVINTCEWPNGPHTLFATARAYSVRTGPTGNLPLAIGRAVSAYVPVTFSNLITKVAFSQVFFEPSLGQTQEVTATFGANVDWTLQMIDDSSNAVRTVTGSGTSLVYDWDGTGDGGTNIPDGVYYYQISAATNGADSSMMMSGTSSLSAFSGASEPERTWILQPDGVPVPLSIYPLDTNGLTIFEATDSEIRSGATSSETVSESSFGASAAAADYTGPSTQQTTTPTRPSTAPIKNQTNNYAIGYYTFKTERDVPLPNNGLTPANKIHLDGSPSNGSFHYPNVFPEDDMAVDLIQVMKKQGWKLEFDRPDDRLRVNSMRRNDQGYNGDAIFSQATIGLFMGHGDYGTDPDYSPGSSGSKQVYFASGNFADTGVNPYDNEWLRLCQFGFCGNLKWMAIHACFCLTNQSSMFSARAIPLSTTHLLLGSTTETVTADHPKYWAENMLKKKQTVVDAWFNAGTKAMGEAKGLSNSIIFSVVGYSECFGDTIKSNTPPSSPSLNPTGLSEQHQTVFTYP